MGSSGVPLPRGLDPWKQQRGEQRQRCLCRGGGQRLAEVRGLAAAPATQRRWRPRGGARRRGWRGRGSGGQRRRKENGQAASGDAEETGRQQENEEELGGEGMGAGGTKINTSPSRSSVRERARKLLHILFVQSIGQQILKEQQAFNQLSR